MTESEKIIDLENRLAALESILNKKGLVLTSKNGNYKLTLSVGDNHAGLWVEQPKQKKFACVYTEASQTALAVRNRKNLSAHGAALSVDELTGEGVLQLAGPDGKVTATGLVSVEDFAK